MSRKKATYSARLAKILNERPDEVREPGGWHKRILEGLPFDSVDRIKAHAALTDAELAQLLGIGEATLRRARSARGALDAPTSDRLSIGYRKSSRSPRKCSKAPQTR